LSESIHVAVDLYDNVGRFLGQASAPADPNTRGVIVWGSRYFVRGVLPSNYHESAGVTIQNLIAGTEGHQP
jgi:hypothetical protein